MESDKSKVSAFFKKQKLKETQKANNPPVSIKKDNINNNNNITENDNNNKNQNLKETNFLIQRKDPNFKEGKKYKEDEIGTTLLNKGYNDLIDEKKNFDVEKMNEDQYNQLRLLNNLHKIANNLEQESDNENEASVKDDNEEAIIDISIKDNKNNEIKNKDNNIDKEIYKEEKNELEQIKSEIEKELGKDLLKDIIDLLDKFCDKILLKYNRKLLEEKITELKNKGYNDNILDKGKIKLDEIFSILMKEKIFN